MLRELMRHRETQDNILNLELLAIINYINYYILYIIFYFNYNFKKI